MTTKTLDQQTARFIASVATCLPPLSGEVMQGWIDNPQGLKKYLSGLNPSLRKEEPTCLWRENDGVIDCDANPFFPKGWKVEEHQKGGQLKFDVSLFHLFLCESQRGGSLVGGGIVRRQLVGKPVLNTNVLDYLLSNQHLIPEKWKGKRLYFWGTIYRQPPNYEASVRCLEWYGAGWGWGFSEVDDSYFGNCDFAILRVI